MTEIPTYRWSLPADTGRSRTWSARSSAARSHAAVFTNGEQARNLFRGWRRSSTRSGRLKRFLNRTLVASIGPVASAALRELEVNVGMESKPPKLGALMSALDTALS